MLYKEMRNILTTGFNTGILNLLAGNTRSLERNDQRGDAKSTISSSSDSCSTVIRKDAVGNPLLCAVDNVLVSSSFSRSCNSSDIRASY
jgi:hypothetical protein